LFCSLSNKTEPRKLKRDADCNPWPATISAIEQVIPAVDVVDINIVGLVPGRSPIFWIRINDTEPIPAVLEARKSAFNQEGHAVHAKKVPSSKVGPELIVGNAVTAVAATLLPAAVLRLPMARTMLLPSAALLNLL